MAQIDPMHSLLLQVNSNVIDIKQDLGNLKLAIKPIPKLQKDVADLMDSRTADAAEKRAYGRVSAYIAACVSCGISFIVWAIDHLHFISRNLP